jgi:hypothetical protein
MKVWLESTFVSRQKSKIFGGVTVVFRYFGLILVGLLVASAVARANESRPTTSAELGAMILSNADRLPPEIASQVKPQQAY